MTLKEIFDKAENQTLTWEQFEEASKEAKFVDLNEGKYVSKSKHENELSSKDLQISDLNGQLSQRDVDLSGLKAQLEAAGADAGKLGEVSKSLEDLQTQYTNDTKELKNQLKKQAYEFAVKEYANSTKFTSNAAKRDFIQAMIATELKMDGDKILGADDFVAKYLEDNDDAFYKEPAKAPEESPQPLPQFVAPSQGAESKPDDGTGGFNFNFTPVTSATK